MKLDIEVKGIRTGRTRNGWKGCGKRNLGTWNHAFFQRATRRYYGRRLPSRKCVSCCCSLPLHEAFAALPEHVNNFHSIGEQWSAAISSITYIQPHLHLPLATAAGVASPPRIEAAEAFSRLLNHAADNGAHTEPIHVTRTIVENLQKLMGLTDVNDGISTSRLEAPIGTSVAVAEHPVLSFEQSLRYAQSLKMKKG